MPNVKLHFDITVLNKLCFDCWLETVVENVFVVVPFVDLSLVVDFAMNTSRFVTRHLQKKFY